MSPLNIPTVDKTVQLPSVLRAPDEAASSLSARECWQGTRKGWLSRWQLGSRDVTVMLGKVILQNLRDFHLNILFCWESTKKLPKKGYTVYVLTLHLRVFKVSYSSHLFLEFQFHSSKFLSSSFQNRTFPIHSPKLSHGIW